MMTEGAEEGGLHFALVFDISKAHRRILVNELDWGLQACSTDPTTPKSDLATIWLNLVGTYGVGTASYWWARMGAAALRCMHYLLGPMNAVYALLYADDGQAVSSGEYHAKLILALAIWLILGFPIKWSKVHGGIAYDYIGYWMDWQRFRIGINERRTLWLISWIEELERRKTTDKSELAEVLGRWTFASRVLTIIRPFLGPIYAWQARITPGKQRLVPAMIRLILEFLCKILKESNTVPCRERISAAGESFRGDARAEEDFAEIGAWDSRGGGKPELARWFSHKMSKEDYPWVYMKGGSPKRVIAALELYTTLLGVMLFHPKRSEGPKELYVLRLSAATDNKGNGFMLDKLMSTAFPSCVILMELAMQLRDRGFLLDLLWVPREDNVAADKLSNGDTDSFAPHLEIPVSPSELKEEFHLLSEMMDRGKVLYDEVYKERERAKEERAKPAGWGGSWARGKRKRLRLRAPWNDVYPEDGI